MEIIKTNVESKIEIFKMTRESENVSEIPDMVNIEVTGEYLEYRDTNAKGEEVEVLSFKEKGGSILSTISNTFKREFMAIMDLGLKDIVIAKKTGKTKSNRDFITCVLISATE